MDGQVEDNFEKKIFKIYKFGDSKSTRNMNNDNSARMQDEEDLHMNEKIIYSLKDLILLNQGKNKLMYFEIVEESANKSAQ